MALLAELHEIAINQLFNLIPLGVMFSRGSYPSCTIWPLISHSLTDNPCYLEKWFIPVEDMLNHRVSYEKTTLNIFGLPCLAYNDNEEIIKNIHAIKGIYVF